MDQDIESWNVITMLSPQTTLNVSILFLKSQKMLPSVIGLGATKILSIHHNTEGSGGRGEGGEGERYYLHFINIGVLEKKEFTMCQWPY